jgi:host factor-I protein
MAQMPDTKATSVPNIQDAFLNLVRRERVVVSIRLMDGTDVEARIRSFDRFAVIIERDGVDALVFKHAIASITPPKATPTNYSAPPD